MSFPWVLARLELIVTEDTMGIFIPSVFVSRSSFLLFRDLLGNGTDSRRPDGRGLWIEISEGQDEAG